MGGVQSILPVKLLHHTKHCKSTRRFNVSPKHKHSTKELLQNPLTCSVLASCILSSSCSDRSLIYLLMLGDDLIGSWKRRGGRKKHRIRCKESLVEPVMAPCQMEQPETQQQRRAVVVIPRQLVFLAPVEAADTFL